jgi:hypothetical protein
MLIKTKENKMRLQFKKVQERANELGLGLSRFNYTGQDANGESIRYSYRMFVATKEEQVKFEMDRELGFENMSGRFGEGLVEADYMSLIAVAHAVEGYSISGKDGLGISQDESYYLRDENDKLITRKNERIYTTCFPFNSEEMNEDVYCNDADINSSVLTEKVRKQY